MKRLIIKHTNTILYKCAQTVKEYKKTEILINYSHCDAKLEELFSYIMLMKALVVFAIRAIYTFCYSII